MNKISTRQLYFLLACIMPAGKLLLLPTRLAEAAGNDLLFPAAACYLLEAGAVFCVLLLAERNTSLYDLLRERVGKVAAGILLALLSLFLLFAALLPLMEQRLFVQSIFYDTLPSLAAFAPFFLFAAYLCAKPLFSLGRMWDLLAPVAIAGLLGILVLSVGSAKFGALLPVGAGGGRGFLKGSAAAACWFFDAPLLLPMLGHIDAKKGTAWRGALFYLAGGGAILFYLAVFYAIYAETAVNQLFAFANTSKYFAGITVLGRIDYLFIFALALVMAFYAALPLQASVGCWTQTFRAKPLPVLLSVLFSALFFALLSLLDLRFGDVMDCISGTLFWIFPAMSAGLPLLLLLLLWRPRRA